MKLKVLQEDIELAKSKTRIANYGDFMERQAKRGQLAECCPIACALKRQFQTREAKVSFKGLFVRDQIFKNSTRSQKFIRDFDDGKEVKPTEFTFDLVPLDE
jgi:hypothetical protein